MSTESGTSWLARWLADPLRALLTWVVLAGLGGLAALVSPRIDTLGSQLLPIPKLLPANIESAVDYLKIGFIQVWFEPFVLQLSVRRGLAWLILRMIPYTMWALLALQSVPNNGMYLRLDLWTFGVCCLVLFIALVPVLSGWRSRPWMVVVAGALAFGIQAGVGMRHETPFWLWNMTLPFAAVLLYGTRLLRPAEARGLHE